jgi:general secretion pathway protein J
MRRAGNARGFTLLELILALAIVGALVAIAFGGLRVGAAAWRQGEERAEAHQHARTIAVSLARAISAAYPYRASKGQAPQPVVLFEGTQTRLEFVSSAPPFPFPEPIAFTAVVIALDGEEPALVVGQRALPNREPFRDSPVVLRDGAVTTLELSYLGEDGAWREAWSGEAEKTTPRAVRVSVGTLLGGVAKRPLPSITVPLRATPPE